MQSGISKNASDFFAAWTKQKRTASNSVHLAAASGKGMTHPKRIPRQFRNLAGPAGTGINTNYSTPNNFLVCEAQNYLASFRTRRINRLYKKRADVGNPPYVSYQNMTSDQRLAAKSLDATGFALHSKASLWAYFVVHGGKLS